MGKFAPGHKKTGGRGPGTGNKTGEQIRTMIKKFIDENWVSMQADFDKASPQARLNFRYNLLKYALPEALSFDRLNEEQLNELLEYAKKHFSNEQN